MLIYGINPVLEALRAGRVRELRVSRSWGRDAPRCHEAAEREHVPVRRVPAGDLDRAANGGVHQGVVAELDEARAFDVAGSGRAARRPRRSSSCSTASKIRTTSGAILRTADAAGGRRRRAAVAPCRLARRRGGEGVGRRRGAREDGEVVNIARALEELKEAGVWTIGLAGDAPNRYDRMDFTLPTAIVVGAEGTGLRRLVRERCDWLVSIPMAGHVQSLNVSVAAGIALFEAVRQRNGSEYR